MLKKLTYPIAAFFVLVVMALPVTAAPATTSAEFSADGLEVTAMSDKDLSNVVLAFCDDSAQKFDNLSGYVGTYSGTDMHAGKEIKGVWIKSGNNQSGDGPGYGEWHERAGACVAPVDEIEETPDGEEQVCFEIDEFLEECFLVEEPPDPIFF